MEQSIHRLPALEHAEIRLMVNGPESFTPDMRAMLGESPQVCLSVLVSSSTRALCTYSKCLKSDTVLQNNFLTSVCGTASLKASSENRKDSSENH